MTTALAILWATERTLPSSEIFFFAASFPLHHFSDLVLDHRFDDLPAIFLPFRQSFRELPGLIGRDLSRQRGLVRIDRGFDQRRPRMMKGLAQHGPNQRGILDAEAGYSAGPRHGDKIDGL